jgi:hypothetical protein
MGALFFRMPLLISNYHVRKGLDLLQRWRAYVPCKALCIGVALGKVVVIRHDCFAK